MRKPTQIQALNAISGLLLRHHSTPASGRSPQQPQEKPLIVIQVQMNALKTAIQAQFDGVEVQLNGIIGKLDAIGARIDAVDARLEEMEERREADLARSSNSRISFQLLTVQFYPVVKYIRGHPVQPGLPPSVVNVNLKPEYDVGDLPPSGLVPSNHSEFYEIYDMDIVPMRRRMRAIYWFYNDDRLKLSGNADRKACAGAINNLKRYLLSSPMKDSVSELGGFET
ncbi:hypothetical protein CASFOL_026576 [Castilleja foliolosa]|uniref:Uncharacterized protein n=1 Tax=Castilleja foliolosa TaxID=1961234 RepID=A0ABD3CII4_9LAMI